MDDKDSLVSRSQYLVLRHSEDENNVVYGKVQAEFGHLGKGEFMKNLVVALMQPELLDNLLSEEGVACTVRQQALLN